MPLLEKVSSLLENACKLLKKIDKKYLIIGVSVVLVLAVVLVLVLIPPAPEQEEPPVTTTEEPTSPHKQSDFALDENGFMTCLTKDYALGIDVSRFQGTIDWETVKTAGVEFVFIRIGGRGSSEGALYIDEHAAQYYEGAKKAGLQVGAYFYSQAINAEEAEEEARFVLEQIIGWELDLPVVYDWEWVSSDARTANVTKEELTQCTVSFCEMIETAGYEPAVYFNSDQGYNRLDMAQLQDYKLWLAYYEMSPDFPCAVDFWQYSCTGTVPGIEGEVDMNLWFLPE